MTAGKPLTPVGRKWALSLHLIFVGLWFGAAIAMVLLIALTFGILAVLSVFMALAVPSLGVDHDVHAGAWKGLWWEKNALGAVMGWGAVSA